MNGLEERLIHHFHYFHSHPELGFEEYETTRRLREALEEAGIEILPGDLKTGLIARVGGSREGRTIGLRCDIDALPVQEETALPYASLNDGRMHACGHDAHAAIMLGAALLLKERAEELHGQALIVFQPAEEIASGAERVLETGLLEEAELFLGVHTYPAFPSGTLGIKEGPVMAAVDRFRVTIEGRGAHAAQPHLGVDPVAAQAALVQSLQTIVSRNLNPFHPALVSVTHVESGNTWNVLPQTALLEGTARTLYPEDRALIRERFCRLTEETARAYGAKAEIDWTAGPPAVINDGALCEAARETAGRLGFSVGRQEDTMGGEDFSLYLKDRPGLFVRVGTGGAYPAHHPRFTVDPTAIYPAARFFAELTISLSNQE